MKDFKIYIVVNLLVFKFKFVFVYEYLLIKKMVIKEIIVGLYKGNVGFFMYYMIMDVDYLDVIVFWIGGGYSMSVFIIEMYVIFLKF